MSKPLFVQWCAKDALDGTLQMDPLSELAYRRIIDMIYVSNDELMDDDDVLQYATKTGSKWKAIKKKLVEVYKKISIENGYVRQATCTDKLEKMREIIAKNSAAGKASANKRSKSPNELENNDTTSTTVENVLPLSPTEGQQTNKLLNQVSKEDKPLTPLPAEQQPDAAPSDPVSFSKTATRETPWFEGKVITWTAGEYDDAMRDFGMTQSQIDEYLQGRDVWYTKQPERVQLGWKLSTIRDFSNQYGRRKR